MEKCLDASVAKFVLTPRKVRNLESYVDFTFGLQFGQRMKCEIINSQPEVRIYT